MTKTYDVCIRGAGIVGPTLALHLASKRLRVALVTTALTPPPSDPHTEHSDIRAYALSPASRALLVGVRCWPSEAYATPVLGMQVQARNAAQRSSTVTFSAAQQQAPALNWIVDAAVLEAQLAQAVQFQPLIDVVPQPAQATLTVVCEGRASSTREALGVEWEGTPYAQSALATRVRGAQPHGQIARQWFGEDDIVALLPMGGADGHDCALVWSLPPARAQALLHSEAAAFCQALEAASHGALGAFTLGCARKTWPLQHGQARRWVGQHAGGATPGGWLLAGDAAHAVHPLAGQGLNLGLGDVAELVRLLDGRAYWRSVADPSLLRAYERARKTQFALVGGAGDGLQQLFSHQGPALQTLRHWGMQVFERSGPLKQGVAQQAMGNAMRPMGAA